MKIEFSVYIGMVSENAGYAQIFRIFNLRNIFSSQQFSWMTANAIHNWFVMVETLLILSSKFKYTS